MKKTLVFILTATTLLCAFGLQTVAADKTTVYVTIANGSLVMTQEPIIVTDVDSDGSLTIYDALCCAHEAKYEGGAAAGFGVSSGDYGMFISKLWGIENGGSCGYYVNNTLATGLTNAVKDGDIIVAFIYQDTSAFSDAYAYFNVNTAYAAENEEITLTLFSSGYDADWNTVVAPVEEAFVLINGEASSHTTGAEGKVTLKFDAAGTYVISALSSEQTLVPPVCVVTVSEPAPETGDTVAVFALAVTLCLIAAAAVLLARRNSYEK